MRYAVSLIILLLIAGFLAYQVAFLHNIRSPGGWIAFVILAVILLGIDGFARSKGVGRWKRVGLTVALAFLVFFINSASTLTRCEKKHQQCHRVFGI